MTREDRLFYSLCDQSGPIGVEPALEL